MSSLPITTEIIDACRAAGFSDEPRTLAELHALCPEWVDWLALEIPYLGDAERAELHALTGCRSWWRDGQRHRDDGPAIEFPYGGRRWYRNGLLHRDDGPAVEDQSGYRAWFRHGVRHRTDGPAVEHADGTCTWWIDGRHVPAPEASR